MNICYIKRKEWKDLIEGKRITLQFIDKEKWKIDDLLLGLKRKDFHRVKITKKGIKIVKFGR